MGGLLRAMLAITPAGVEVVGFVSSSPQAEYDEIAALLPSLGELRKSALAHRQLVAAWQRGLTPAFDGMVHSPSLFAALSSRDDQSRAGSRASAPPHSTR